jgi:hypothetical protein
MVAKPPHQPAAALPQVDHRIGRLCGLVSRSHPTRRIVVASYSNDLATRTHRRFRTVIEAPSYQALFAAMRPARDTGTELVTVAGGNCYATFGDA